MSKKRKGRPNPRDICPVSECKKASISIQNHPEHFSATGEAANARNMLRCVLYEMWMLANAVQVLRKNDWPDEMIYQHPKLKQFDPSELIKRSALVSFRILLVFLYPPNEEERGDDFQLKDFSAFGADQNAFPQPRFIGFEDGGPFTKESINKYIAHLTWTRINKSKCIPQPKFKKGTEAIVQNSRTLLNDAWRFVKTVTKHADFPPFQSDSAFGYLAMFNEAMKRLGSSER